MTYVAIVFPNGEQVMPESSYGVPKLNWPFDPAVAVVKIWSYRVTRERQRNCGAAVIAMITDVGHS
jgi:hypothetical protein